MPEHFLLLDRVGSGYVLRETERLDTPFVIHRFSLPTADGGLLTGVPSENMHAIVGGFSPGNGTTPVSRMDLVPHPMTGEWAFSWSFMGPIGPGDVYVDILFIARGICTRTII